jgi:SAM-dependent methyltransferase
MKRQLGRLLAEIRGRWLKATHRPYMQRQIQSVSSEYTQYLDAQLERTLRKNDGRLKQRTVEFVDKLSVLTNLADAAVLSVGCRNHAELDYFSSKGVKKIVGVDLYSDHDDILVMDMHQMTFPDNEFDIVYSSHSLEHAYDIQKAVREFTRVCRSGGLIAIEAPINFEPGGADLVDIGSLENLYNLFAPCVETILWSEQSNRTAEPTSLGVIRAIFKIVK